MPCPQPLRRLLILACCCLCLYPACLVIPQGYRQVERAGHKISPPHLSFVVPGQTTKAQFIDQVGQPYLIMDDWGVMAYYWKMLSSYVLWAVPGGGGVAEKDAQYLLLVAYDEQGLIQNHEIITVKSLAEYGETPLFRRPETVNEHALRWAGHGAALGKFSLLAPPPGQAVIYVYYSPTMQGWENRLDGIFLDNQLWGEIQWGEFIPIIVAPGSHTIGFEPGVRRTDKFLHPHRLPAAPAVTTTLDIYPNQSYFLEICFVWRHSEKTATFSVLSETVARPRLAGLQRVR